MRLLILAIGVVLFTSCSETIRGTMKVEKDMDFFKKNKEIFVPVGQYQSEITFNNSNKVKFVIKGVNGEEKKIQFIIPEGTEFPRYDGEIFVDSLISKQPYDLHGIARSETSHSVQYNDIETCTYSVMRPVCHTVCRYDNGRQTCHDVCRMESVAIYGRQHVSYYYKYVDTNFIIDFLGVNEADRYAQFLAKNRDTHKHYTYVGSCY